MAFRRPGLAWMALLVLAAAGVVASAPQLHGHPVSVSEMAAAEGCSGRTIAAPVHSNPLGSDECLACQIFTITATLHAAFVLVTPVTQGPSSFVSPAFFASVAPLHATRGRAPPAS